MADADSVCIRVGTTEDIITSPISSILILLWLNTWSNNNPYSSDVLSTSLAILQSNTNSLPLNNPKIY